MLERALKQANPRRLPGDTGSSNDSPNQGHASEYAESYKERDNIVANLQERMNDVEEELKNEELFKGIYDWVEGKTAIKTAYLLLEYDVNTLTEPEKLEEKNLILYGYVGKPDQGFLRQFQGLYSFDSIFDGEHNKIASPEIISTYVNFIKPNSKAMVIAPYEHLDPEKGFVVPEGINYASLYQK